MPAEVDPPLEAARIAEAHDAVRADSAIQFQLPRHEPPVPPDPPQWLLWLARHLDDIGRPVFWLVVAVVAALAAWLLFRVARSWWLGRAAAPVVAEAEPEWRLERKVARALLAEAEALAAEGRYAEAVRLLLHRSVEHIAERRPALVRPASTGREIARAGDLPPPARTAFAPITDAVERSLFGGRVIDRSGWEEAREAYRALAVPGAWR